MTAATISSAAGFRDAVQPLRPLLHAHARRLTDNGADTDDLVQDTLLRAWRARDSFIPGTNLRAWLLRIQRNGFLNACRNARRWVALDDQALERRLVCGPCQEHGLYEADLAKVLDYLPKHQRDALLSISDGERYEEAAQRLGLAIGTLKSQIFRARSTLLGLVNADRIDLPRKTERTKRRRAAIHRRQKVSRFG